jgi:hypothetical protein
VHVSMCESTSSSDLNGREHIGHWMVSGCISRAGPEPLVGSTSAILSVGADEVANGIGAKGRFLATSSNSGLHQLGLTGHTSQQGNFPQDLRQLYSVAVHCPRCSFSNRRDTLLRHSYSNSVEYTTSRRCGGTL